MSDHSACVKTTIDTAERAATFRYNLRLVVEWWDGLPPTLRQDIEGSGKEPGCIGMARRLTKTD